MTPRPRFPSFLAYLAAFAPALGAQQHGARVAGPSFAVSFPRERSAKALDGRLLLLISSDSTKEPRFQIADGPETQLVFGVDVDGLAPGKPAIVGSGAFGYPVTSLRDLPPGRYWVQALLNRYETFRRADGHVVKLPPDMGEGQHWERKPGNLYSTAKWVRIDPRLRIGPLPLVLDQEIPPIPPPAETKYVKHVRLQSQVLTRFWGRPVYLGAHVLLPEGFEQHPNARGAGLERSVPAQGLQPDRAAVCLSALPGLDRPGLPPSARDRDSAPHPVLRRLLRRELGQQRSIRRRPHAGVDPVHRAEVSRTPTSSMEPGSPAPIRSISGRTPW